MFITYYLNDQLKVTDIEYALPVSELVTHFSQQLNVVIKNTNLMGRKLELYCTLYTAHKIMDE